MTKSSIALVAIWIASTIAMMMYFSVDKLVEFDPKGELHFASMQSGFNQKIEAQFLKYTDNLENQVFHIKLKGCYCNTLNELHTQRLDQILLTNQFQSHHVLLNPVTREDLIPLSTPAIVVFDDNGKLAYLGPYSVGLLCSIGNSFVDTYIENVIQNKHFGPFIVSDAQGCYCNSI